MTQSGRLLRSNMMARKALFIGISALFVAALPAFELMHREKATKPTESQYSDISNASSDESLVDQETDLAAIEELWKSLQEALLATDVPRALQHFAVGSRQHYGGVFRLMGPEMARIPERWSDFTPIELTFDLAIYAIYQDGPDGKRLHTITFVRDPDEGWLIQRL